MKNYPLIALCLILLSACSDTKTVENELETGMKEVYEISKAKGEKSGSYYLYFPEGNLFEESHYKDGKLDGTRTLYYPSGKKEIEEQYRNDTIVGKYRIYHENGNIKVEGSYKDGMMAGIWKSYYPSGTIKEEVTYKENIENGRFVEYYEGGSFKAKGQYKGGDNEHGLLYLYDSTGIVERVMLCDNGICRTQWTQDSTFTMPTE